MTFGEKLQGLRKQKGISQEELANQLNVSRQAVSKWENDAGFPEMEKMLMLGNIFQVSMDYLLKEDRLSSEAQQAKEQGYYASREKVQGLINHDKKDALGTAIAILLMIYSGLPILFLPHLEDELSIVSVLMIGFGIILLVMLGCKEDPYVRLRKEPLSFDQEVLKYWKQVHKVKGKIYTAMVIGGIALIIACCILAIFVDDVLHLESTLVDPYYLLMIGAAVYLFIYSAMMSDTYDMICENQKYVASRKKGSDLYYYTIGIGALIYIGLGLIFGEIAWMSGWVIPAIFGVLTGAYLYAKRSH